MIVTLNFLKQFMTSHDLIYVMIFYVELLFFLANTDRYCLSEDLKYMIVYKGNKIYLLIYQRENK